MKQRKQTGYYEQYQMYQTINGLAKKLEALLNRTAYVFEIFKWGVAALRSIASVLSSFPKPPDYVTTKGEDSSEERSGELPESANEGAAKQ